MGLWSFVKDAGKSLFGSKAEAATVPDAETLKQEVKDLGLNADAVEIRVEGDKVVVKGDTLSAEDKEKVILAVGNVAGVAQVEAETAEEPVFHTVVKGDTLWALSRRYDVSIDAIAQANDVNPNVLHRWLREHEREGRHAAPTFLPVTVVDAIVPTEPAEQAYVPVSPADLASDRKDLVTTEIQVECVRGHSKVTIRWPLSAAADCGAWIKDWLS